MDQTLSHQCDIDNLKHVCMI